MSDNRITKKAQMPLIGSLVLMALTIAMTTSIAQAAPCFANTANIPQGWVDPATQCGAGNSSNNIGNATVNAATLSYLGGALGGTWTTITTLSGNGTATGFTVSGINSTAGTFSIGSSLLNSYGQFVLVLKDGARSVIPSQVGWTYFLIGGTNQNITCAVGTVCGQWSMWGNPNNAGNQVQLSHATLYASGTRPSSLSAPGSVFLLVIGLIVLTMIARKRNSVPSQVS